MNNVFNLRLKTDLDANAASFSGVRAPFLTIITRTQGRRAHTLVEVLTCLTAQSDTDFEVLLLGHRLDADTDASVSRIIEDCPAWLRNRIRFIAVRDGTRTRPLQIGLMEARGDYVAVLDDDDIVFTNWVETFRDLSHAKPGRVLRSNTVLQVVDSVSVQGLAGLRAAASPELRYPKTFNFFDHLLQNQSPPMLLAFPRQRIEDERIGFDERLTTTEDWDFLMRCAQHAGVADAPAITSVYRWWNKGESSRTVHRAAEWQANHQRIWDNWDAECFRLPPGSMRQLVSLLQEHAAFSAELRRQHQRGVRLALDPAVFNRNPEQRLTSARLKLDKILNSTCWRLTRPLRRMVSRFTGAREINSALLQSITVEQAEALVIKLYGSRSWRFAAPIRVCKRMFDRLAFGPVMLR